MIYTHAVLHKIRGEDFCVLFCVCVYVLKRPNTFACVFLMGEDNGRIT